MQWTRSERSTTAIVLGLIGAAIVAGCDSTPPPIAAPEVVISIETDRFDDAMLEFAEAGSDGDATVLRAGMQYEFAGQFRLLETEVPIENLENRLSLSFLVDLNTSGFESQPSRTRSGDDDNSRREVIMSRELIQGATMDRENVVSFQGEIKAPNRTGECEARLSVSVSSPEGQTRLHILSQRIRVIDPMSAIE